MRLLAVILSLCAVILAGAAFVNQQNAAPTSCDQLKTVRHANGFVYFQHPKYGEYAWHVLPGEGPIRPCQVIVTNEAEARRAIMIETFSQR